MTDVGGTTHYYNADERQSVRNLTDATGVVVNDYDYTAYGDKVDSMTTGAVTQRYTYTGRELSYVSGDYYYRNRSYSAHSGTFMQRDPIGYEAPVELVLNHKLDRNLRISGRGTGMSLYSSYFSKYLMIDPMGLAGCETCGDKKCKSLSGTDWYERTGKATIACDGDGNLVPIVPKIKDRDKYGVSECTRRHEKQHVKDWKERYGDDVCKGCNKGHLPVCELPGKDSYKEFRRKSECKAHSISLKCLAEKRDCDKYPEPEAKECRRVWFDYWLGAIKAMAKHDCEAKYHDY